MRLFCTCDPQAFHRLSQLVADQANEILQLKTALKLKSTEWDDVLDKITKQAERMRKRSNPFREDAQEAPQKPVDISQDPNYRSKLLSEFKRGGL